jgi:PIN domain nuclease of toxin-antitoxin system
MKLLIDTHFLFWLTVLPEKIAPREQEIFDTPGLQIFASAASYWELSLKWPAFHKSGQRKLPANPQSILPLAEMLGIMPLDITVHHGSAGLQKPLSHNDPFDLLLLTQAQEEGLRLLTRDQKLLKHPLAFKFGQ